MTAWQVRHLPVSPHPPPVPLLSHLLGHMATEVTDEKSFNMSIILRLWLQQLNRFFPKSELSKSLGLQKLSLRGNCSQRAEIV